MKEEELKIGHWPESCPHCGNGTTVPKEEPTKDEDVRNCLETHVWCNSYCGRKRPAKEECNQCNYVTKLRGKTYCIRCDKEFEPIKAPLPEKISDKDIYFENPTEIDLALIKVKENINRLIDYLKERDS